MRPGCDPGSQRNRQSLSGKFDASDTVQQTLLEAWKDWDDFRGDGEPQRAAWLGRSLLTSLPGFARHYAGTQKRDVTREFFVERVSVEHR